MQIPIKCPWCKSNLINEFYRDIDGLDILYKLCVKNMDHKFLCFIQNDKINLIRLSFKLGHFYWNYKTKQLFVNPINGVITILDNDADKTYLPWIDFDFNESLIRKLQTYVLFK